MNAKQYLPILVFLFSSYCLAVPTLEPSFEATISLPKDCYTQGLSFVDNSLWLSCGQYNQSRLYLLDASTGEIEKSKTLPKHWFAEGNSVVGNELIQLTWKNRLIGRFDKHTLTLNNTFLHEGEGWGLAFDNSKGLILSDGSAMISFIDPTSFNTLRRVEVTDDGEAVFKLNELEWVNDEIWANVWQAEKIAIIDPQSGHVKGWLDMAKIIAHEQKLGGEVLNGIAFDPDQSRVFITGKNWQHIYTFQFKN